VHQFKSSESDFLSPSLTVDSSAPIGVRCPSFPPALNPKPDSNPYLAQTDIYTGFGLGKPILTEDLKLNTFPLTSTNFPEFVTDRELKRFCILQLKISEVIHEKDILQLENQKGKYDSFELIESYFVLQKAILQILPHLLQQIQTQSFMTLWEIWKFITMTLKITFSIEKLRQILAESHHHHSSDVVDGGFVDLEYYYLHLPPDDDLFASSDGLRVKQIAGKKFHSKNYFEDHKLCVCHLFNNHYGGGDEDVENDTQEDYDTFDTFAQYSNSYSQTYNQWNPMASSLPVLTCCDLETCLVPHIIVYKLKHQIWPESVPVPAPQDIQDTSRTKTSTPRKKKFSQKSDVTLDLISSLKSVWEEE
jgi:hypothetical protein